MLIRQKNSVHIPKKYLFNAAAALFGVVTVTLAVREMLLPKNVPACDTRYSKAGLFAWQRGDGSLLSPVDLQAKLAGRDWGVIENVHFARVEGQSFTSAMKIALPQDSKEPETAKPSGVGFVWTPSWLKGTQSACLGYSVKVPEDFKFGPGGSLPGLFGGEPEMADAAEDKRSAAFSARLLWRENAMLDVRVTGTGTGKGKGESATYALDHNYLRLPKDTWLQIEQEIALNTPGQADGILRVWVNGEIKVDRKDMMYRTRPGEGLLGVIANTHYASRDLNWAPAPKSTSILLSPFYVRWQ